MSVNLPLRISIGEITDYTDDIFVVTIYEKVDITKKDLLEIYRLMENISNGLIYKTLINAQVVQIGNISKDAFSVNAKNKYSPHKKAEAFVIKNIGIKIIANFYTRTFKPAIPTKVFNNSADALKWLKGK